MKSICEILIVVLTISLSSYGWGRLIHQNNHNWIKKFTEGFFLLLSLCHLFSCILIYCKIELKVIFILFSLLSMIGIVSWLMCFVKRIKENKKFFFDWRIVALIGYCLLMCFVFANRTLGETGFDTVHYMSMVNEGSIQPFFGQIHYETGEVIPYFNAMYDFQGYYAFCSMFLSIFTQLNSAIFGTNHSMIYLYYWPFSILFFLLLSCVAFRINEVLEVNKGNEKFLVLLVVLGFVGNMYWNNCLPFYGNSYRGLLTAYACLRIYEMFKNNQYKWNDFIGLSVVFCAQIACSSSGLFISFLMIYGFLFLCLSKDIDSFGKKVALLCFPVLEFAVIYQLVLDQKIGVLFLGAGFVFFLFCFVYDWLFTNKIQSTIKKVLKYVLQYAMPVGVLILSVFVLKNGFVIKHGFFDLHSAYDMVWDFFDFSTLRSSVVNFVWLFGLVFYLFSFKEKSDFKKMYWILIVTFINPISFVVVYRFLADAVYYRIYEIIFNAFTLILFITSFTHIISNIKIRKAVFIGLTCLYAVLTLNGISTYYHYKFKPSDDFNVLYKTENDSIDVMNKINDILRIEKLERPSVVSQIEGVKGYIAGIYTPISVRETRWLDKFSITDSSNELMKVFVYRDFIGQEIFSEAPKFECACDLLIDNLVDFVIIAKNQAYMDENGEFVPLSFRVRDCGNLVYENEEYLLYRFYW